MRTHLSVCLLSLLVACGGGGASGGATPSSSPSAETGPTNGEAAAQLPLVFVADVDLPGKPVRFDYQDVDRARGHLIVAHMNDASVIVADLKDGSVLKVLPNVPTARGVVVANEIARIFVTSSPDQIVAIDADSLSEVGRITTGRGPDGIAWDPVHRLVATSDQADGAVSIIGEAGNGAREQIALGSATGNVVFDPSRSALWITVVGGAPVDQLVRIDPVARTAAKKIDLPGCDEAHGLRIHPDGKSALVACEGNATLLRVDFESGEILGTAKTATGPDVLAIDPGLGWIYVAAESGDLTVFDIAKPGLTQIDRERPGDAAHSVAVDPATHRVFFPLVKGAGGTPVLRIMRPGP
jgi:DNA-binding beta-propeller fold protein YncE